MKSFWRNEDGNVALIFGLAVIPIVLGVGVAVDYSRASSTQQHLQEIVDAAALAGARDTSTNLSQIERVARAYFDAHVPPKALSEVTGFDVSLTNQGAVRVVARGTVPTTFTAVAGIETLPVSVSSEVVRGVEGSIEVAMVLDNTGSMATHNKIGTLRDVSEKLVNDIKDSEEIDAKFALVPFADYVNVGTAYDGSSWLEIVDGNGKKKKTESWHGCVGSRAHPLNLRDADYGTPVPGFINGADVHGNIGGKANCPAEIQPLTEDTGPVIKAIRKMKADGCTYIPGGLMWGWRLISERAPFTQADPTDPENVEPRKIIVLLTDGENTVWPDANGRHVSNNCSNPWKSEVAKSDDYLTKICQNVKDEGIEIYTIAFQVTDTSIKNIMEGCASGTGHYFDATDDDALEEAFADLTSAFKELRIAR